jgi:dipeptidyl aminopeptidase/acylaminoacyl peptidase
MRLVSVVARAPVVAVGVALAAGRASAQAVPEAIVTEGVPPIPASLAQRFDRYRHIAGAAFAGWFAGRREILLRTGTRAGGTAQIFSVVSPGDPWHQMTGLSERIRGIFPRPGRNQFVLERDVEGNEVFQLALFDAPTGRTRRIGDGRSHQEKPRWSRDGRVLAFSSNARNSEDQDVYLKDVDSLDHARILREAEGRAFVADWSPDGKHVAVVEFDPRRGVRLMRIDVASGQAEAVNIPPGSKCAPDGQALLWSGDSHSLYWTTADGSEFRRLARHDLSTGLTRSLTDAISWDVEEFDLTGDGGMIVFVANEGGISRLHLLDAVTGQERRAPRMRPGRISGVEFRPGSDEFAFQHETAQAASQIYSYIPRIGQLVRWTHGEPGGPRFGPVAEPELIHYRSFDGREIPAFVYRPVRPFSAPRPVLIDIHGGPQSQFRAANLGAGNYLIEEYGVVRIFPNVRGSSGYGRSYAMLDDGPRREDAVSDIGSLLDWIATQKDLDASRVAVTGGSYGGFVALAALTRYGDRLRAGVSRSGISDLAMFLDSKRGFVQGAVRAEFGDERDPAIKARLHEVSPLTHADRIRVPLLVIHGANDPRVPVSEAEQIVAAARRNGGPVWYILASNEGHDLTRRENQEYVQYAELMFLERYLLGGADRK